jgi:two-component system, NarL family, response regulator YdfI
VIRLLIIASSAVVRAGLETLAVASPELQVVGAFSDFTGARDVHADVVLAAVPVEEIPAPPAPGVLPLVVMTNDPQPVWTLEALGLGVRALLPRDASQSEILAAVEAAGNGFAVLDPHELDGLLSSSVPAPKSDDTSPLTERELEVLRMLAEGASNKIIAWKLGISEHTVKFHVGSILARLGASSRTEAVSIGIRRGLILL